MSRSSASSSSSSAAAAAPEAPQDKSLTLVDRKALSKGAPALLGALPLHRPEHLKRNLLDAKRKAERKHPPKEALSTQERFQRRRVEAMEYFEKTRRAANRGDPFERPWMVTKTVKDKDGNETKKHVKSGAPALRLLPWISYVNQVATNLNGGHKTRVAPTVVRKLAEMVLCHDLATKVFPDGEERCVDSHKYDDESIREAHMKMDVMRVRHLKAAALRYLQTIEELDPSAPLVQRFHDVYNRLVEESSEKKTHTKHIAEIRKQYVALQPTIASRLKKLDSIKDTVDRLKFWEDAKEVSEIGMELIKDARPKIEQRLKKVEAEIHELNTKKIPDARKALEEAREAIKGLSKDEQEKAQAKIEKAEQSVKSRERRVAELGEMHKWDTKSVENLGSQYTAYSNDAKTAKKHIKKLESMAAAAQSSDMDQDE